jgi:hypothetical protein
MKTAAQRAAAQQKQMGLRRCRKRSLIVFYEDLVLVDFDDACALVREHLPEYFIDDTFVDKAGQVIHFLDLERIDAVSVFVYQPDADIGSV